MLRLMFLMLLTLTLSVDEWELIDVQPLREIIGEIEGFDGAGVLSPDGSRIAWTDQSLLCIYTFSTEDILCRGPYPVIAPLSEPVWSPDSQRIAVTEQLKTSDETFLMVQESDLYLYDTVEDVFTNLTDDGYDGRWNTETFWLSDPSVGLDLAPAWNPATGDLLFFSITEQTLNLYQYREDALELLFVVTFDLSVSLGTSPFARLERLAAVVSPDGTQIAVTWLPAEGDWGVFLLDSVNPGRWTHLVDADDLRAGLPDWSEAGMIPYHVEWAQDGLLISAYGQGSEDQESNMPAMAYFVTLPQGDVQPLVEMSAVPDMMSMQHPDDTGLTPIAQLPRAAVVAPDGVTAFYFHYDFSIDYAAVSAVALPPDGTSPVLLGELPDFECCTLRSVSSSENGQMLTYGSLFTFAR